MKKITDSLHHIVTRLSTDDRKKFKQELYSGKKKTQAADMFDFFCSIKEFDSKAYGVFIKRKRMEQTAASVKSQLKEKLLHWLVTNSKAPEGTNWYYQLAKGELLMQYELFDEAEIVIQKVREESYRRMVVPYEWISLTLLSAIVQNKAPELVMPSYIEITDRMVALSKKLYSVVTVLNYYTRTNAVFYECRSCAKATHHSMATQLKREHYFNSSDAFSPLEERFYVYGARAIIHLMLGDVQNAYRQYNNLYRGVMEFEDVFIQHQPYEYSLVLRDYLYYCLLCDNIKEYEELRPLFVNKISNVHKGKQLKYNIRLEAVQFLYLLRTKQFSLLKDSLAQYEKYISTAAYELEFVASKKEALTYAGYAYLALRQWDGAAQKFNELLNLNVKAVGVDHDYNAHFMLLLCAYAEHIKPLLTGESSSYLINKSEAYYNYILKQRLEAPIEKMVAKAIKELAAGGNKKEQFQKAQKMLERVNKQLKEAAPFYNMQLAEFNWVEWLVEITQELKHQQK